MPCREKMALCPTMPLPSTAPPAHLDGESPMVGRTLPAAVDPIHAIPQRLLNVLFHRKLTRPAHISSEVSSSGCKRRLLTKMPMMTTG